MNGEIYPVEIPSPCVGVDWARPATPKRKPDFTNTVIQWATSDGERFVPTAQTTEILPPGYYEIDNHPDLGLYFRSVPIKLNGILEFPDAVTGFVLDEIKKFWDREKMFADFDLTFKRGILLYGSPGGGKSTTLQLASKDVIERGGIVIKFQNPHTFISGIRKFREIQPETPVVVLMEDIDSTLREYSETEVINILDGVDKLHKIVFLATTNYPESLGDRIINRPSRFDKRFEVGAPNDESRKMYFEFLIGDKEVEIDLNRWVNDTDGMTISHLKELFVTTVIMGNTYDDAIKTLKDMGNRKKVSENSKNRIGLVR